MLQRDSCLPFLQEWTGWTAKGKQGNWCAGRASAARGDVSAESQPSVLTLMGASQVVGSQWAWVGEQVRKVLIEQVSLGLEDRSLGSLIV